MKKSTTLFSGEGVKFLLLFLFIFVTGSLLQGAPYPASRQFDLSKKDSFRQQFHPNGWKGYRPFPAYGYDEKTQSFHVSGKHHTSNGFCFNSHQRVAVKKGQILRIRVEVKGSGEVFVAPQYYCGNRWSGIGVTRKKALPGNSFQWLAFDLPVTDIAGRPSDSAILTFGGSAYSELYIKRYQAEVLDLKDISGKGPFLPSVWQVFGPFPADKAKTLDVSRFSQIPEKLHIAGKDYKARTVNSPAGEIKLDSFYKSLNDAVWMFGYVDSSAEEIADFGAGCDWWMRWFVNGKRVMDNFPDGNFYHPCSITDFPFNAPLKKGRNLIAVYFQRGVASAVLRYGSGGKVTAALQQKKNASRDLEKQYLGKIGTHRPRLFLTPGMIADLKKNMKGTRKAYFEYIRSMVDRLPEKIIRKPVRNAWGEVNDYGLRAGRAALVWTFSGEQSHYRKALLFLEAAADWYNERFDAKKAVSWYGYSRIEALHAYDLLYNKMTPAERKRIGNKLLRHIRKSYKDYVEILRYNGEGSSGPKSGFYGTCNTWWYAGVVFHKAGLDDEFAKELMNRGFSDHMRMFQHRIKLAGNEGGPVTQSPGYVLGDYWKQEYRFYMSWRALTGENYADRMGHLAALPEWIYRSSIPISNRKGVHVQDFGSGDCAHFNNRYSMPVAYLAQFTSFYGKRYPRYAAIARHLLYLCGNQLKEAWQPTYRGDVVAPLLYDYEYKEEKAPVLSKAKYYKGLGQLYMQDKRTPDGTFILFTGGGSSVMHKHIDEGNFIIYKNGFQVMDTGARLIYSGMTLNQDYITNGIHSGNYFLRASAHNCLLIHMPGEDFGSRRMDGKFTYKLVNDGGMTRSTGGKMLLVKTQKDHTYACLDLTAVYNSRKARSVIRHILWNHGDIFVVYDRIHSVKGDYKKTFLCHTGAEPVIKGNRYFWNNMAVTALLPEKTVLTKVGGPGKEFVAGGKNFPISPKEEARRKKYKFLYGEWRVDSSPAVEKEVIHFLHVFHIGKDHGKPSLRSVGDQFEVTVPCANGKKFKASFRKDGKPFVDYSCF